MRLLSYTKACQRVLKTQNSTLSVLIDDDAERSFDENASFRILSSINNARFSPDGKKITYDGSGSITIRYKYDDNRGHLVWLSLTSKLVIPYGKENLIKMMHQERVDFREARLTNPNYDPDNPPSYAKKYREKGRVTKTVNVKGLMRHHQLVVTFKK